MAMLQEESNLNEIVQLVGKDSLSAKDQITLEVARMIREDFLQQNSFADNDAYSEYDRQARMLSLIRQYDAQCLNAAERGGNLSELFAIPAREKIGRAKGVPASTRTPMRTCSLKWKSRSPRLLRKESRKNDP